MSFPRLAKYELPEVTWSRLQDELKHSSDEYEKDLKNEIMQRPNGLEALVKELTANYINLYTDKTPSERIPVNMPSSVSRWLDWGLSCAGGLFATNQSYAKRARAIAEEAISTCKVGYEKSAMFDRKTVIYTALNGLEKVYNEMLNANIKTGQVINMLQKAFLAYKFIPSKKDEEKNEPKKSY
ncbi:MAG: hypothetical protein ABI597_08360 [Gammaproteobacteria bacterium]